MKRLGSTSLLTSTLGALLILGGACDPKDDPWGDEGSVDDGYGDDEGDHEDDCGDEETGDETGDEPPICEPCAGTQGQLGLYFMDFCELEGGTGFTGSISCQDALDNCILNDLSNPNTGIYCEWDGQLIYRNDLGTDACVPEYGSGLACEEPAPTCELDSPCAGSDGYVGVGVAYVGCDSGSADVLGPMDGFATCEQTLAECDAIIAANPGQSVFCVWNDLALRLTEAVPGDCSDFDPC